MVSEALKLPLSCFDKTIFPHKNRISHILFVYSLLLIFLSSFLSLSGKYHFSSSKHNSSESICKNSSSDTLVFSLSHKNLAEILRAHVARDQCNSFIKFDSYKKHGTHSRWNIEPANYLFSFLRYRHFYHHIASMLCQYLFVKNCSFLN